MEEAVVDEKKSFEEKIETTAEFVIAESTKSEDKKNRRSKSPEKYERWYRFRVLTPNKAILRGTTSTTDKRFKILSRGRQESAASAVAIVIGHLFQPPDWTSSLVDKVLEYGDRVFRVSQARCKLPDDAYLTTNLLQTEFFVGDYKCQICVESGTIYGNLASESSSAPKLSNGVPKFFENFRFGVLTTQGMSVGIWKHEQEGYFCFDPAPTDETGKRCLDGFACLIRSPTVEGIVEAFSENLNCKYDSRYCIDRMSLAKVKPICRPAKCGVPGAQGATRHDDITVDKKTLQFLNPDLDEKERNPDCTPKEPVVKRQHCEDEPDEVMQKIPLRIEMTNYAIEAKFANQPLIEQTIQDDKYNYDDTKVNVPSTLKMLPDDQNVAILHGWTHAYTDIYKAKGAQISATSVMAIAYKKVHPVRSWTRESLDQILTLGTAAYEDVKSTKPSIKQITAADMDDMKFKIDEQRIIIDSDLLTIVGTFVSKNPLLINLKTGLEEFFLKNTDGVLESGPVKIAIWLEDDYYYMFDSVQCDFSGMHLPEPTGGGKQAAAKTEKKQIGKSCVMRFSNLPGLYSHIMGNIDASQNFSRWSIKRINILNDVPGIRDWHYFKPGELGKSWILRGTINSADESFDDNSRGLQDLAIAVASLVTFKLIDIKKWFSDEIDDTIREGDAYYNWCIPPSNEALEEQKLVMKSLKKFMYYKNRKTEISVKNYVIFGEIEGEEDSTEMDFRTGLEHYFESHDSGIVEMGTDQFYAVWRCEEELKDGTKLMGYFIFLSQPSESFVMRFQQDEEEPPQLFGCVLRFLDINELVEVLKDQLITEDEETTEKLEYAIHDVKAVNITDTMSDEDIEKDKAVPIMPDLREYKPKGNYGAVLGGSYTQSDETIFKRMTVDRQQAANSLVALAMSKLFSPHLWTLEMVDDILRVGNRMTEDNLKNLAEPLEDGNIDNPRSYLLPSEINGEFRVGVNQFSFHVEENYGTSGKLVDLGKFLEDFFANNKMGVIRLDEIIMPIWKEDSAFFVMDPRGKETGNAAVYWFMDIQELSDLIVQLCTIMEMQDADFVIDAVNIEHAVEETEREPEEEEITEEHWYKFITVEEHVWKIDCGVTLEDERFKEDNRGQQKAAVCVMALIFSKVYEPRHWNSEVLDEVVITGNKLHSRSAARLGTGEALLPRDIVTEFFLANRRINLNILDCVESGKIKSQNPDVRSIGCGISHFFREYSMGCLVIGENEIFAMWKVDDFIYFFNPGVDLMRFEEMDRLVQKLQSYAAHLDFEITMIEVVDWNKLPPWKYDPSPAVRPSNLPALNAYHRLNGKARAILRGTTHQSSEIFADGIRGRQTASNCIIALAMSVIRNSVTWTKKNLDEILVAGVNLHRESLKATNKVTTLQPRDLVRVFKLGVNIFAADIQNDVITGIVAQPPPEPEEKGKGKKKAEKKPGGKKGAKDKVAPPPPAPPMLLEEGLRKFFEKHHAGVLITGRYMVALWRDSGVFFVYDPRPRNEEGLATDPDDPDAASCVVWFACVEPLFDLISYNIPDDEKYANFEICSVIVKTIPIEPLPTPAGYRAVHEDKVYPDDSDCPIPPVLPLEMQDATKDLLKVDLESCFQRIDKDLSIMLGHLHIDQSVFPPENRGLQSTAVAAVVVVVASLHAPSTWTPDMIDAILKNGDTYYTECARCFAPGSRNLTVDELFEVFVVGDVRARVKVFRNFCAGVTIEPDLRASLELFFEKNSAGIMHTTNYAVGIVKHWGKYYFLDPTDRNRFKDDGFEGAACLVKCETIPKLSKVILRVCSFKEPTVYSLNVIRILDLHFYTQS